MAPVPELAVLLLPAKECHPLPEARRGEEGLPLEPPLECSPDHTLISDSWPLEL